MFFYRKLAVRYKSKIIISENELFRPLNTDYLERTNNYNIAYILSNFLFPYFCIIH